jgi:single-stranded-DNA-specific exonuclease
MRWRMAKVDDGAVDRLAEAIKAPRLAAAMLVRRGLADHQAAEIFLNPSLKSLPDPSLLPDLDKAADRIVTAISAGEKIAVYGDYDADGLTAAALVSDFLTRLGAEAIPYIPHRLEEGYGLHVAAMEHLAGLGVTLVVSVDCGISDHEAAVRAKELGLDLIVTDHHQVPERLPPVYAAVNPHRRESRFPQRSLAGVGVAFFLAGGVRRLLREKASADLPELAPYLGLVALGTIADVAPLTKVNRILVSIGLSHLGSPQSPGLAALKRTAALPEGRPLTAREVAFRLAPRLNAAGRLGPPAPGLRLLTTQDPGEAAALAEELEKLNQQRRRFQTATYRQAVEMLDEAENGAGKTIILAREGWPCGVVGLAASKLAERYRKPAVLLSLENGRAVGSGRSIDGFNLYEALHQCRDLMVRFGGHAQAAGLTVAADQVDALAHAFESAAAGMIDDDLLEPTLDIEAAVNVERLLGIEPALARLAPFGQGNPEPVFALMNQKVVSAGCVGDKHLKLTVVDEGRFLNLIGFQLGDRLPQVGPFVHLAVRRNDHHFRGRDVKGWQIVDLKPPE